MRLQRVYHEARLFRALKISHETFNLIKQQPELKSFSLHMAPRTFYPKSQEVVYKKTGSSARPKFMAAYAKVPVLKKSADIHESEPNAASMAPPLDGAEVPSQFGPGETSSCLDYEIPQRKKKVGCHIS